MLCAGDSRAVIQRGGKAESLTRDHKPDREDEAVRARALDAHARQHGAT